jgi:hypothetical protein
MQGTRKAFREAGYCMDLPDGDLARRRRNEFSYNGRIENDKFQPWKEIRNGGDMKSETKRKRK